MSLIENLTSVINNTNFSEFSGNLIIINPIASFFLGIGITLFIALLGWSDQIRTPQKESKQLEKEFMERHGIDWEDLRYLVREGNKVTPTKRVKSLMSLMEKRQLESNGIVNHFDVLKNIDKSKEKIEKINMLKYEHTIYLTILSFVFGIGSMITNLVFRGALIEYVVDIIFIVVVVMFVFSICSKMLIVNKEDEFFRKSIKMVSDEV